MNRTTMNLLLKVSRFFHDVYFCFVMSFKRGCIAVLQELSTDTECSIICTNFVKNARLEKKIVTAQNIIVSPNFLVWKSSGKAQFPQNFWRFYTRKLGEFMVF